MRNDFQPPQRWRTNRSRSPANAQQRPCARRVTASRTDLMPEGSADTVPRSSRGPRPRAYVFFRPASVAVGAVTSLPATAVPPWPGGTGVADTVRCSAAETTSPGADALTTAGPGVGKLSVACPAASVVAVAPPPATVAPPAGDAVPSTAKRTTVTVTGVPAWTAAGTPRRPSGKPVDAKVGAGVRSTRNSASSPGAMTRSQTPTRL